MIPRKALVVAPFRSSATSLSRSGSTPVPFTAVAAPPQPTPGVTDSSPSSSPSQPHQRQSKGYVPLPPCQTPCPPRTSISCALAPYWPTPRPPISLLSPVGLAGNAAPSPIPGLLPLTKVTAVALLQRQPLGRSFKGPIVSCSVWPGEAFKVCAACDLCQIVVVSVLLALISL